MEPAPRIAPPQVEAVAVLKDEPATRVEKHGVGAAAEVHKTYRNLGLRRLQSFLRRSRAEREHANLRAVTAAGVPCTPPRAWRAVRQWGMVVHSVLVTGFVADAATLKTLLGRSPPLPSPTRRRLAEALGSLLRRLHDGGILWCTPMPRNVLVVGPPEQARLALCDAPAAVVFRRDVPTRHRLLDLFDAFLSPSRRRDWSSPERLRALIAYTGGDRRQAAALWRTLLRRSRVGHRVRKNLLMALRTYILPAHDIVPGADAR